MKGLVRAHARIFRESDTVKRIPRRPNQSLRDFPTYTIPEAALYLGIPVRTLRYWVLDHPIWPVAGREMSTPLLSFRDVAQAYYVELVRKHFSLTTLQTRRVMEAAAKESKSPYPLLKNNIKLFYKHVVMDKPARGKQPRRIIDLSHNRQLALPAIIDSVATRIRWDSHQEPTQLFPWRHWTGPGDDARPVSMRPDVMSGRLVIAGTRIPVQTVLLRSTNESISAIAKDYELPERSIQQALSHFGVSKKAA